MILSRRTFLAGTAAAIAAGPAPAAGGFADYTPGLIAALLDQGRTLFVDYHATWCSTCARQMRVIEALMQANPDYARNIAFVRVDWDTYRDHAVTVSRNIPRRSTLIVLKGDRELGRIVAGTGEAEIRALIDLALAAATSA